MDRGKQTAVLAEQDVFGAVAVVDVEVVDGNAFEALRARFQGGNRNGVEIAEAHCLIACGVMTGWSHQAETDFAGTGAVQSLQCATDGASRVIGDVRVSRRVGVEVGCRKKVFDMFGCMCTEQNGIVNGQRVGPGEVECFFPAQFVDGARDALRPFGMAARGVFGATRVGDDFHFEPVSDKHYTNDIELNKEFQTGS